VRALAKAHATRAGTGRLTVDNAPTAPLKVRIHLNTVQAEVRALAKRMLRKRERDELLEGGYNKYAFHDDGLPRWFAEDQRRHARCVFIHKLDHCFREPTSCAHDGFVLTASSIRHTAITRRACPQGRTTALLPGRRLSTRAHLSGR